MLCYDVMDLVGQEVSLCRAVYQNKTKYDSVVSSMRDVCWEAYYYGTNDPYSIEEYHEEAEYDTEELYLDDYYEESYGTSFISDFKNCIYEYWAVPQELRSNLDV